MSNVDVSSVGSPASALARSRAPARTEEESCHSRQANIIETTTGLICSKEQYLGIGISSTRVIKTLTTDVVVVIEHCT